MFNTTDRTYLSKQHQRYQASAAKGQTAAALDAVWRGASARNLLLRGELSAADLSPSRITELLRGLGW